MVGGLTHVLVSVAVRDEPGALARVTRQLAGWHINLDGVIVDASGMRFVTEDADAMRRALDESGFLYRMEPVQKLVLEDRPGALSELSMRLAEAGVDIRTVFGAGSGSRGYVYLSVDDWARAAPILDLHSSGPTVVHTHLGRIA